MPVYRAYNSTTHLVAISASDMRPDLDYVDDPPWHSTRGVHVQRQSWRLTAVLWTYPSGERCARSSRGGSTDRAQADPGRCRSGPGLLPCGNPAVPGRSADPLPCFPCPAQRDALLCGALALLHLTQFDEPFGLSVVEAMGTGRPVIAFRRGSMPELIDDGVSGFPVAAGSVDDAVAVDRSHCRVGSSGRASAGGVTSRRSAWSMTMCTSTSGYSISRRACQTAVHH
jgi:hypothetical protein